MIAGKPTLPRPTGPRILRRCPTCGKPIHFQAVHDRFWWLYWIHVPGCSEGPKLALLAESESGLGDWTAFAVRLSIPLDPFNEIAVQLGILPPTKKGVGRLLGDLERRVILQAYRSVNGEEDEKDEQQGA